MRATKYLFAIALICSYSLVFWKGIELARFALLKESADSVSLAASRQPKNQLSARASELVSAIKSWQNVSGVRSDAVTSAIAMTRIVNPNNFRELEAEAISILAVRPMSAQAWILLAEMRLLGGKPIEQATSALQTGLMLGPNEDDFIAERLVCGLLIWEHLAPGAKERIATDLAIVGERAIAAEIANVRTVIAGKDQAARDDIRGRLEKWPERKASIDKFKL